MIDLIPLIALVSATIAVIALMPYGTKTFLAQALSLLLCAAVYARWASPDALLSSKVTGVPAYGLVMIASVLTALSFGNTLRILFRVDHASMQLPRSTNSVSADILMGLPLACAMVDLVPKERLVAILAIGALTGLIVLADRLRTPQAAKAEA